jgi:tRNA dimethylallyltransferase
LHGIAARGHHALLVGGTGLYLRAVVDDLQFPGRFPTIKAALEDDLADGRVTVTDLHERLGALDPVAAGRMEPTNHRRVVRALEVTLGSGQPFSTFGPGLEAYPPTPVTMIGLTMATEEVDRRIAERFGRWVEEGLLEEVRALAERPGGISRTARQALGYRELLAHVEEGAPLDACMEEAVRRTRSFVRRQASWFRRDPRIRWTEGGQDPADLLDRSLAAHASRS